MTIIQQGLENLQHFALAPTASRAAALNGTSVDLQSYDGDILLILDVASGGTSTCTVTLQDSDDNITFAAASGSFTLDGTLYATSTIAFAQVSTTASKQTIVASKDGLRRYVKAVSVEGGTHVYSVNGVGVKKYG